MQRRDFFKNAGLLAATGLTASIGTQTFAADPKEFNTVTYAGKTGKAKPEWGDQQVEHFIKRRCWDIHHLVVVEIRLCGIWYIAESAYEVEVAEVSDCRSLGDSCPEFTICV